jgi:PiT family inorganic phosphate transporter
MQWRGLYEKVLIPALASPALAIPGAVLVTTAILWIIRRRAPGKVNRIFRRLQLVSAGFVSLAHGTNDAQKTMGVIALALVAAHPGQSFHVPVWVIASAAAAMGLGTYAGGWRIIRTLGQRVAKIEPPQGFAAETTTATILWLTAHFGFPVSTTHVVSTAVLGSGAATRFSAVRWGILVAWLITLPCAGLAGGLVELLTRAPGGAGLAFAVGAALALLALSARTLQARRASATAEVVTAT